MDNDVPELAEKQSAKINKRGGKRANSGGRRSGAGRKIDRVAVTFRSQASSDAFSGCPTGHMAYWPAVFKTARASIAFSEPGSPFLSILMIMRASGRLTVLA